MKKGKKIYHIRSWMIYRYISLTVVLLLLVGSVNIAFMGNPFFLKNGL